MLSWLGECDLLGARELQPANYFDPVFLSHRTAVDEDRPQQDLEKLVEVTVAEHDMERRFR